MKPFDGTVLDETETTAARGLLRIVTAGSVDDGKSTLVGRLLYDSKSLHDDQLAALERAALVRGLDAPDLAQLTDGLRAEREQGITIDVAYRYFSTPRRSFIVADTPGHVQYTRNMVTGASTADLAIVLVDVRNGVSIQSRRHGFISALLKIPHVVVCVNKMDLVDYSEERFRTVAGEYATFAQLVGIRNLTCFPIAALQGDNVVERSRRMEWYTGPSLMQHLETVEIKQEAAPLDFRLPVQLALRPNQGLRGFAGQVASGHISAGEAVRILPSGRTSHIRAIFSGDQEVQEAAAGDSVVVTLADEVDVGRGDMIVRTGHEPAVAARFESTLCWLSEDPLDPTRDYVLRHTTRETRARVVPSLLRVDVETLRREPVSSLALNEIGLATIEAALPLAFDSYAVNRVTGSFILIDPHTHNTIAAGLIERESAAAPSLPTANVVWEAASVSRSEREARNGHKGAVLWFTGLSGAGKSTIAHALERRLFALGCQSFRLDGDNVRHGLNADLGFGDKDRTENIRRVANVAALAYEHGQIVLCTFISPLRADRAAARALLPTGAFFELYVRCNVDECERRDPKGLYARARSGEIPHFTGVSSPYEEPAGAELVLESDRRSVVEIVEQIVQELARRAILSAGTEDEFAGNGI